MLVVIWINPKLDRERYNEGRKVYSHGDYDKTYGLEPLAEKNIDDEVAILYEDILNWECGHTLTLITTEIEAIDD